MILRREGFDCCSAMGLLLSLRGIVRALSIIASEATYSRRPGEGYSFAFSRRDAPEVLKENLALETEAQGRPGARCTAVSRAMCIKECCTRAYRFSGEHPAFPAQWLYGLYEFALVTGFLATIISGSFRSRET